MNCIVCGTVFDDRYWPNSESACYEISCSKCQKTMFFTPIGSYTYPLPLLHIIFNEFHVLEATNQLTEFSPSLMQI